MGYFQYLKSSLVLGREQSAFNLFLFGLIIVPLQFAWLTWLLPRSSLSLIVLYLTLNLLIIFLLSMKNTLHGIVDFFRTQTIIRTTLILFVLIPCIFQGYVYLKLGDLSWDSHNYHIPLIHMIWQFKGFGDWPQLIIWQYNPAIFEIQSSFFAGILKTTSAIGFVGGAYLLGIYYALYRLLVNQKAPPTTSLAISTVAVASSSTLFFNAFTAYCDTAQAFFWVVFLDAVLLILRRNYSTANQGQLVLGIIGILSTKYSSIQLVPIIFIISIVLIAKNERTRLVAARKWYLLLPLATFWPVRSFIETGQPFFPIAFPGFSGWSIYTIKSSNEALVASRGSVEAMHQSIFENSFYNWFGAIPDFIQDVFHLISGESVNLWKYFGYDPRPLGFGPLFHILFSIASLYFLIRLILRKFQVKDLICEHFCCNFLRK